MFNDALSRSQKAKLGDCKSICLHASAVMISIKRQGSVRKMVIITNLRGLVQNTFIQKNKNEYSLDKAKKKYKNSAEGVIAPAGAKVTGATIRMWLLNKFISFLAVLTWKKM